MVREGGGGRLAGGGSSKEVEGEDVTGAGVEEETEEAGEEEGGTEGVTTWRERPGDPGGLGWIALLANFCFNSSFLK